MKYLCNKNKRLCVALIVSITFVISHVGPYSFDQTIKYISPQSAFQNNIDAPTLIKVRSASFPVSSKELSNLPFNKNLRKYNPETDLGISAPKLRKEYIGNFQEKAREINRVIEEARKGEETIVELNGIRYELKLSGSRRIWVFKKTSKEAFAEEFGLNLRRNELPKELKIFNSETDIGISGPKLREEYVGTFVEEAREVNRGIEEAREGKETAVELNGIQYELKLSGSTPIWVFKRTFKETFAKIFDLKIRKDLRKYNPETDMGVSSPILLKEYSGKSFKKKVREINRVIEEARKGEETIVELYGIRFELKLSGSIPIWVFKRTFKEIFDEKFGFNIRKDLRKYNPETDIGVSSSILLKEYIGKSFKKKVREINRVIEEAREGEETEVKLNGILYELKFPSRGRPIWVFKRAFKETFAKKFGLKVRKDLRKYNPETDIGIVRSKLREEYIGGFQEKAQEINRAIEEAREGEETEVKLNGILYELKLSGAARIWVFDRSLKEIFAEVFGLKVQKELRKYNPETDIGVSSPKLQEEYVGGLFKEAQEITRAIEKTREGEETEVELNGIRYELKLTGGGRRIWVFDRSLKGAFAEVFGLKVRKDLRKYNPETDLGISQKKLQKEYLGKLTEKVEEVNRAIEEARDGEETEVELNGIKYELKLSGPKRIWVFDRTFKEAFAVAYGIKYSKNIRANKTRTEMALDEAIKTLDKLKDQGILQVVLSYGTKPEVLRDIVSILGDESQVSFEELQKMIGAFRKYMNLEEVTMYHGFPPLSQTDKTEVLLKTMIEKAYLLENRNEGEQDVLIRAYLRFIYRKFSKDAEAGLTKFNLAIDKAMADIPNNQFLHRFKQHVNEEFTEAMSFESTHLRRPLQNHQRIGAYRLTQNDRFALLDGTRVGKTRQVLAAMDLSKKTLIVSPSILVDIWVEEEAKAFKRSLGFEYLGEETSKKEKELVLKNIRTAKNVSVVLQGGPKYRKQLLEKLRKRKNGIIHISMETLRQLGKKELELLNDGLGAVVVDEWQYLERYLSDNIKAHSLQGGAIQEINPPVKWLLSASPFGTDPYKLYSLFHYLMKDGRSPPPDWAMNARIFRKVFTESLPGFRSLSANLAKISLRREAKDVFEMFDPELSAEEQPFSIPEPIVKPNDEDDTGRFELTESISNTAISMIEDFRGYIADVYNPYVKEEQGKRINRDYPLKLIAQEDLNILAKVNFLNCLMVKPDRVGLREESPFWKSLDEIMIGENGKLKDKKHKILIYAQNKFMVHTLIEHFENAGYPCARIDGTVTGWAKDPKDKTKNLLGRFDEEEKFHPGEGNEPIRAKSWERHKFQNDDNVQICVANIRAGVGMDLSRGDTVIYAQPPRTYTEYYQSQARVMGFNPRHIRSKVEIIHMIAQYPQAWLQKLEGTPQERYVRKGTITEIHINERLVGQREQFRMIIEGIDQKQLNLAGLSLARLMPGVLEDESLNMNGLTPRRKMLQESVQKLAKVCYSAGPEIKRSIYKIIRAANAAKADLTEMSESILDLPEFNAQDILILADIADIPNHNLQRKLYNSVGEALNKLYEKEDSLTDYAQYWEEGKKLKPVSGHSLVALLASGMTKKGIDPPLIIENMIEEIRSSKKSKKLFIQLTEAILDLKDTSIPHDGYFLQTGISIKKRINLLKSIAELAASDQIDLHTLLKEDPGTFKKYEHIVKITRLELLKNFIDEQIDKKVSIRALQQLEKTWGTLEPVFTFLRTIKHGDEESLASEEAGLTGGTMKRELKRIAEILYHITAGDYSDWRNRQQGKREFGMKIGFLAEEKQFWREWTRELSLSRDSSGWELLSELKVLKSNLGEQTWQDLQTMIASINVRNKIIKLDGINVADKVKKAENEGVDAAIAQYEQSKKNLGMIRNAVLQSAKLSNTQKLILIKEDINETNKPSELLELLDQKLRVFTYAIDWLTVMKIDKTKEMEQEIFKACERIHNRMELSSNFSGKLREDMGETLEALKNGEKDKTYFDVEIEITSDPKKILQRGMLSPYLMNCFQLEGDWRLNRCLIDDLGSRNKMLVIVKSKGKPHAVAMAKIKKLEDGTPVVFLERILHIKGSYDFKSEIFKALAVKVKSMGRGTLLADSWHKNPKGPIIKVFSTNGYSEDEYSEAHFKIRKNNYNGTEYEFWNSAILSPMSPNQIKEDIPLLEDLFSGNEYVESAA